tara:strand:- start:287 stop:604 length:318 start_codon:yes stop_codon:yes gene_type:complete
MIITAIIDKTALEEKPEKISEGSGKKLIFGNWLSIPSTNITTIAVKSIRNNSVTNKKMVTPRTTNIRIISKFNSIGIKSTALQTSCPFIFKISSGDFNVGRRSSY